MTAKGGRFLADFGRFPKVHEHELPFVNEPLSIQRMVGGETQADGMEVNYLFPTPFFLRATLGGMNKIGEDNDQVSNTKPRSWSQFTYLGRLSTYFDLTDNHSIELGTSMAYTPSVRLAGDPSGGDPILNGVDLTYRYQPLSSAVYQGLTWGSEFYTNSERFERYRGSKLMTQYCGTQTAASANIIRRLHLRRSEAQQELVDGIPSRLRSDR